MEKRLKAVRCKRGISNIIGEVLVLAIVVGLMTGVIIFYNALVNPIQQDYKSTAQQAEDSLKERFLIEDVQFFTQGSAKELNVTVFNFGDISLSIATVYINGIMLNPSPPSNLIGVNQSGSFVWAYSWSTGGIYQVKVVTGRGTVVESAFSP
jgi:archaellum component FlaF (FlaF/FlaG flagellin family)